MKKLTYPFTKEQIVDLKVGDMVLISGKLFTFEHHREALLMFFELIQSKIHVMSL
jgi:tartrate dehydratase beta subunit/fumarate hydratase class I family protein